MLQVLQRIESQTASYRFESGFLNSTVTATSTAFEPSHNDVLVNILWFASLIVSLVTASFGILVKQWLREYLAVEVPSPQARLRVRHLRYPALHTWKVFEIAAALPLLLQIALGLFFAGLCYLTISVHPSVYHTTLPLVLGWAVCISAAVLMPILYARCPYRTTFLRPLHLLRRGLILAVYVLYIIVMFPLAPLFFIRGVKAEFMVPDFVNNLVSDAISGGRNRETEAISNEDADADILAAVDAIQSNDELLATTIAESLEQVQPSFSTVMTFIVRVVQHRLQNFGEIAVRAPVVLDLRTLSRRSAEFVLDMACKHFNKLTSHRGYLLSTGPQRNPEIVWMFALLLSVYRVELSLSAQAILAEIFLPYAPVYCSTLIDGCYERERSEDYGVVPGDYRTRLLLQQTRNFLQRVDASFSTSWKCLQGILSSLCRNILRQDESDPNAVDYRELYQWLRLMSKDCQELIERWLFEVVYSGLDHSGSLGRNGSLLFRDAVAVVANIQPPYYNYLTNKDYRFIDLFRRLLAERKTADLFVNIFLYPSNREPGTGFNGLGDPSQARLLFEEETNGKSWDILISGLSSLII
jgi:hypothetical protein